MVHEILKNNKNNTQNATKTTKTTVSLKKCVFAFESQFLRIHIGRKGWGSYIKIIGVWGRVYGVLIPGVALVAGPHRPRNSAKKFFYIDFDGPKCHFFYFSKIWPNYVGWSIPYGEKFKLAD